MDQVSQIAYLVTDHSVASFVPFKQHAYCDAMLGHKVLKKAVFWSACSSDHNEITDCQIRLLHCEGCRSV